MLLWTVAQVAPLSVVRPSVRQGLEPFRLTPSAQSWLGEVGSQAWITSPEPEGHTGWPWVQVLPPSVVRSTEKLPLTKANSGSVGCMEAAGSLPSVGQEVHLSGPQTIGTLGCGYCRGIALPMGVMGWGWTRPALTRADME